MLRVSRNACFRGSSWSRILSSTTPPRAALRERPRQARRSSVEARAEWRRSAASLGSRRFTFRLRFLRARCARSPLHAAQPRASLGRSEVSHDRSTPPPAPRRRERRCDPLSRCGAPRLVFSGAVARGVRRTWRAPRGGRAHGAPAAAGSGLRRDGPRARIDRIGRRGGRVVDARLALARWCAARPARRPRADTSVTGLRRLRGAWCARLRSLSPARRGLRRAPRSRRGRRLWPQSFGRAYACAHRPSSASVLAAEPHGCAHGHDARRHGLRAPKDFVLLTAEHRCSVRRRVHLRGGFDTFIMPCRSIGRLKKN